LVLLHEKRRGREDKKTATRSTLFCVTSFSASIKNKTGALFSLFFFHFLVWLNTFCSGTSLRARFLVRALQKRPSFIRMIVLEYERQACLWRIHPHRRGLPLPAREFAAFHLTGVCIFYHCSFFMRRRVTFLPAAFCASPRNETLNIQTAAAACLPAATAAAAAAGWRIMNMTFYVSKHNNATQCHISFKTSHLFSLCAVPDRRRLRHPPTFLSLLSRAANSWIKIVLRAQQQQQLPVQPVQEHKAKSINFFEI
jgi:hypothetical protein